MFFFDILNPSEDIYCLHSINSSKVVGIIIIFFDKSLKTVSFLSKSCLTFSEMPFLNSIKQFSIDSRNFCFASDVSTKKNPRLIVWGNFWINSRSFKRSLNSWCMKFISACKIKIINNSSLNFFFSYVWINPQDNFIDILLRIFQVEVKLAQNMK